MQRILGGGSACVPPRERPGGRRHVWRSGESEALAFQKFKFLNLCHFGILKTHEEERPFQSCFLQVRLANQGL